MSAKSVSKIVLAAVVAAVTLSPALAAKRHMYVHRIAGPCAQPSGRCITDCDELKWCRVYVCNNGKSTPVPFPRCFEPSGLCFAAHC